MALELLRAGNSCVCVRDQELYERGRKELYERGGESSFLKWLEGQGFVHCEDSGRGANPFIYINLTTKVYGHGVYGCRYISTIADSGPMAIEEFKIIYSIFQMNTRRTKEMYREIIDLNVDADAFNPDNLVAFERTIQSFVESNEYIELTRYREIMQYYGIEWKYESMVNADVSGADHRLIMTLFVATLRADHFCEGVIVDFWESGALEKWMNRLRELCR